MICRRRYECSQDQWDIYKLDPLYDCYVRAFLHLTVITCKLDTPQSPSSTTLPVHKHPTPPSIPVSMTGRDCSEQDVFAESACSSNWEEEFEVENMVIDNDEPIFSTNLPQDSFRENSPMCIDTPESDSHRKQKRKGENYMAV